MVDASYPLIIVLDLSLTRSDRNTQDKKLHPIINQEISADKILVLILNTAQFEVSHRRMFSQALQFVLGNHFKALLQAKQARWEAHKKECSERMNEMGTN